MSSATPFDIDHPKSMLEEILGYSLHPNIIYGRFSRSIRLHLGNLSGSFQIIDNVMLVFFFLFDRTGKGKVARKRGEGYY